MLEIKNVTKVYVSKGGVETKALDDVSINFGETGLVFLLGKSGSGKSTLLNVAGGLDEPTSGEVIVKGKSSKDFSGSDFDSYRNTFVGFVFQEYNILDEFNVEDNIALALELQGKPKDKEKIHALLEDVDLAEYAKRKPNTLSGGQKQRIAIARALVKEPQIIMADEPTGALDSATGKQVLETLKNLSKTRLVVIVSHDREFAETYGDRIVELKDGKIISDVSKRSLPPEEVSKDITVLSGDTMTIKGGATLDDSSFKAVKDFLSGSEGDVIITRGDKQVQLFRKANRIGEDGSGESFSATESDDVTLKQYTAEESKFIRSRLPVGKAIKIGASGLKLKPLRLFFTIFLSFIAFTLFGLFSTLMTYNPRDVAAKTFAENGDNFISVGKSYHYRYVEPDGTIRDEDYMTSSTRFTDGDVDAFVTKFGAQTFGTYSIGTSTITNFNKQDNTTYYKTDINQFTEAENGSHSLPLKTGGYPRDLNEITISSFMLDVLKKQGIILYNEDGEKVDESNALSQTDVSVEITENNVVGKYIMVRMQNEPQPLKVVGVFDSGAVPTEYSGLSDENGAAAKDYALTYKFDNWYRSSLASTAIVASGFYSAYGYSGGGSSIWINEFSHLISGSEINFKWEEYDGPAFYSAKVYDSEAYFKPVFISSGKTSLSSDEIVVPASELSQIFSYLLNDEVKKMDNDPNKPMDTAEWDSLNPEPQQWDYDYDEDAWQAAHDAWLTERAAAQQAYTEWNDERQAKWDLQREYNDLISVANGNSVWDQDSEKFRTPSAAEIEAAKTALLAKIKEDYPDGITVNLAVGERSAESYKLAGYYFRGKVNSDSGLYVSEQLFGKLSVDTNSYGSSQQTNYVEPEDAKYTSVFVPYDKTMAGFYKVYDICGFENLDETTDVLYEITSPLYSSVTMVNDLASMFSTIFLWVGVVFAVFAALLLFNFISMSISNKRKEIGILRAVGARGGDVFKIFFAESGIIVGICLILSIIGAAVLCSVINGILRKTAGFMVTLFVFSYLSPLMMIALALVVALISTFLPVFFAARKKPVESIRAL